MSDHNSHFRKLSEWHRKFAQVAPNQQEREARLRFADYLQRRADELEEESSAISNEPKPSR
jgi:hypothetical protein